jgi:hypothetical protein
MSCDFHYDYGPNGKYEHGCQRGSQPCPEEEKIKWNTVEHDSQSKGNVVVTNRAIREMARCIALEHFVCYAVREKDRKVFYEKIDQIALAIKLLLKNNKIPCEKEGLFVEEGEAQ